ncbi:MAG: anaerobic sulfatase maturase [Acidimicrobiales bacterium]|jgi:uncharacterized protein|nr:anaerobic sulfatase maturase [Acidimicrobiales bacterium]
MTSTPLADGGPALPALWPSDAPAAFHVLAKPSGAICNLDCTYCFFLSKELLYPGDRFRMAEDLLATYLRQLVEAHRGPEVTVAWQGGEPTLLGLPFFRRSVELTEQLLRPGQRVQYTIQTNGTLLDDEWCAFLAEHHFLVGLSVDGPRALHDAYRVDKKGRGTFDRVMEALATLQRHEVDVNILCTVHAANQDHAVEVYRFFRDDLGMRFLQFIPIVERATPDTLQVANLGWSGSRKGRPLYTNRGSLVTERSVGSLAWGRFLAEIFDEWVRHDVGEVFVQHFDAALASWLGVNPAMCIYQETCGVALALEHNGDLYSCDHFVEPEHRLGNIRDTHLVELVSSPQQVAFGLAKRDTLPAYCRSCDVRFACNGECPKNRFTTTPDGEAGLNYLCAGYKHFFHHVDEPMRLMADLLRQGREAPDVMAVLAERDAARFRGVGRNEPCPCGSGRKFKHCHADA